LDLIGSLIGEPTRVSDKQLKELGIAVVPNRDLGRSVVPLPPTPKFLVFMKIARFCAQPTEGVRLTGKILL
jgi:hypothetical protein